MARRKSAPKLQFSLMLLLGLATVTSCLFAYVRYKLAEWRAQRAAILLVVDQYDALIKYSDPTPTWLRRLTGTRANDLGVLGNVVSVDAATLSSTDEIVPHPENRVPSGLGPCDGRFLMIGIPAGDEDITWIRSLPSLKRLTVSGFPVRDRSLAHLRGLHSLRQLDLSATRVSDQGITHLKTLTNLEQLDLSLTQVSTRGVKELQRALPNCKIVR